MGEEKDMVNLEAISALGGARGVPIEVDRRGDPRNKVCGLRGRV